MSSLFVWNINPIITSWRIFNTRFLNKFNDGIYDESLILSIKVIIIVIIIILLMCLFRRHKITVHEMCPIIILIVRLQ